LALLHENRIGPKISAREFTKTIAEFATDTERLVEYEAER